VLQPTAVNLGVVPAQATASSTVLLSHNRVDDHVITVTSFAWSTNPGSAFRVIQPAPPFAVRFGDPVPAIVSFTSPGPGEYEAELQVSYRVQAFSRVAVVRLKAVSPCDPALAECTPKTDACLISTEDGSYVRAYVPKLEEELDPAMRAIRGAHGKAIKTYTLPFNFLWRIAGLGKVIPEPPACCEGCDPSCVTGPCSKCLPGIEFHRLSERLASFVWRSPDSTTKTFSGTVPGVVAVALNVPSVVAGRAVVSPGYVEFFFFRDQAPELTLTDVEGSALFQGHVLCTNSSPYSARVRQFEAGSQPPHLNMVVVPSRVE
jgi:hypothetical protein